ncbi:MAG TPA: ribulose-bisphosphate carboxylase large subunit family protein [Tepidisphaeraceae bacterium]|nr:ribulose-bisphosphate carboxylase large subunit family protein [Tepidisphaeraceae bacterium]
MSAERIQAVYRIETPLPVERAAAVLAGEQSSGTFVEVPGETDDLRRRYGARVELINPLEPAAAASLPGCRGGVPGGLFNRAQITVSWPVENIGVNLPTLLATVQGNLYELSQLSGIKLLSIALPDSLARHFRGPAFGAEGSRALCGVVKGPMIGTIIKPSIGLSPDQTAELVRTLVEAGIDFIKDDELLANPPHSPFKQRVDAVMQVINEHAHRTGRKVMVAFNLTDEFDAMQRNYDHLLAAGGTCAMLSVNHVGLSATKAICDRGQLAIHAHRNGFGMMNRHPMLGMEFPAYQTIWRLAGVDQLHVNGIANKFWEPDDHVVRSIEACLAPMNGLKRLLPVISSGQTGLQAPETYRRTQTIEVLYQAGGGIMAHPLGPAAGVAALRQAWQAAVSGITLDEHAREHVELRGQLKKFGK